MNIIIINLSTYRGDLSAVTRADRRTVFGNPFIMKNKASLRQALEDVKEGRVKPISELWQRINVE